MREGLWTSYPLTVELAPIHAALGRPDEGRALLEAARVAALADPPLPGDAVAREVAAVEVELRAGDPGAARAALERAERYLREEPAAESMTDLKAALVRERERVERAGG